MNAIVQYDVLAVAPELGNGALSDTWWANTLAFVNQFNLTNCDTDADRYTARTLLAAHLGSSTIAANTADGAAGPVTGASLGDARVSYAAVAMTTPGYLATTRYGQVFSDVLGMSGAALPGVV